MTILKPISQKYVLEKLQEHSRLNTNFTEEKKEEFRALGKYLYALQESVPTYESQSATDGAAGKPTEKCGYARISYLFLRPKFIEEPLVEETLKKITEDVKHNDSGNFDPSAGINLADFTAKDLHGDFLTGYEVKHFNREKENVYNFDKPSHLHGAKYLCEVDNTKVRIFSFENNKPVLVTTGDSLSPYQLATKLNIDFNLFGYHIKKECLDKYIKDYFFIQD